MSMCMVFTSGLKGRRDSNGTLNLSYQHFQASYLSLTILRIFIIKVIVPGSWLKVFPNRVAEGMDADMF